MNPTSTIIVMAKAPVPGYAKTRLIPALGADGAARLAQQLLNRAVKQAVAAHMGQVNLCCSPDSQHLSFVALSRLSGVNLSTQGDGDLGQRMSRAFDRSLARHRCVLMIGTDAPALDSAMLRHAAQVLADTDAVFVPALDGGYALIGLRRPVPSLFEGVAWSTAAVMAQTRERLAVAGLRHKELPAIADIDEPADLAQLPAELRPSTPSL
jgi:rSAM/selenodomain-associated transferase 1